MKHSKHPIGNEVDERNALNPCFVNRQPDLELLSGWSWFFKSFFQKVLDP